jgi:hypothetical protein
MKLLDSISFPGSKLGGGMKTGTGDDRYAFDEAAGLIFRGRAMESPPPLWAANAEGPSCFGSVRR